MQTYTRTKRIQGMVIAAAFFISGAALVHAWVSGSGTPPQANISTPLTVSAVTELKRGAPNTLEGIIGVNDLYIRSIGKWASELIIRGTRSVDFVVDTRQQPLSTVQLSSSNCNPVNVGNYNCGVSVQKDCRQDYYVVGCSGSVVTDLRPGASNQPPATCTGGNCAYIGSVPYPFPAGGPGVQNTGCVATMYIHGYNEGPGTPIRLPPVGSRDALVVYSYCAKAQ